MESKDDNGSHKVKIRKPPVAWGPENGRGKPHHTPLTGVDNALLHERKINIRLRYVYYSN